jgi:hypothetical protein
MLDPTSLSVTVDQRPADDSGDSQSREQEGVIHGLLLDRAGIDGSM